MDNPSVYVLKSEAGPVKVGIAKNVAMRAQGLSQQQPFSVAVVEIFQTNKAREIEALAHKLLRAHRIRGEWFNVSAEKAVEAVKAAIFEADNKLEESASGHIPQFTFRIDPDLRKRLDDVATKNRRSTAAQIQIILDEWLESQGEK